MNVFILSNVCSFLVLFQGALGRRERGEGVDVPDPPLLPSYPDITNGSITQLFNGTWFSSCSSSPSACLKILKLQRARESGHGVMYILDESFTLDFLQQLNINSTQASSSSSSPPEVVLPNRLFRNITLNYQLWDGQFESDKFTIIDTKGFYSPITRRGLTYGTVRIPFKSRATTFSSEDLERIQTYLEDPTATFPSTNITMFDSSAIEDVEAGSIALQDCHFTFYFTLDYISRPYTKEFRYPPDIDTSSQARDYFVTITLDGKELNTSDPYQIKDYEAMTGVRIDSVMVPQALVWVFSPNCAVNMTSELIVYNNAAQLKMSMVVASFVIFMCIFNLFVGILQIVKTSAPGYRGRLSALTLYLTSGTTMTIGIAFVLLASTLPEVQSLLLFTYVVILILGTVIHMYMVSRHFVQGMMNRAVRASVCFLFFYLLTNVFIGVLPIAFGVLLPYWANLLVVIPLLLAWMPQIIMRCVKRSNRPSFLLAYFLGDTILKTSFAAILFSPNNFLLYEGSWVWTSIIIGVSGIQALLFILQHFLGYDLGLRILCCKRSTKRSYRYDQQLISDSVFNVSELPTVTQIIREHGLESYLATLTSPFLLPFEETADGEEERVMKEKAEKERGATVTTVVPHDDSSLITQSKSPYCMNPYHAHSLFYAPTLSLTTLLSDASIPRLTDSDLHAFDRSQNLDAKAACTNCFYISTKADLDSCLICAICLDSLRIWEGQETYPLQIFKNLPGAYRQLQTQDLYGHERRLLGQTISSTERQAGVWITPCKHCFHKACLNTWLNELMTCPIDRMPLPDIE
ncbi:RING-H2 zinc finger domain-containing protein [Giardia muris]|uniref:RING-H2 zinc finger domain-containing protein n=1 Tax=Giardia muris TaxID=5742 RepID=A0A4Z1T4F8_GIAMU|nr:RING-H2 zinc finger domain-containing protein [Giardia muris]|eukprot:TNJ28883.1 RING-H2 zinc finger domain-containing protein [Giardia muris]